MVSEIVVMDAFKDLSCSSISTGKKSWVPKYSSFICWSSWLTCSEYSWALDLHATRFFSVWYKRSSNGSICFSFSSNSWMQLLSFDNLSEKRCMLSNFWFILRCFAFKFSVSLKWKEEKEIFKNRSSTNWYLSSNYYALKSNCWIYLHYEWGWATSHSEQSFKFTDDVMQIFVRRFDLDFFQCLFKLRHDWFEALNAAVKFAVKQDYDDILARYAIRF